VQKGAMALYPTNPPMFLVCLLRLPRMTGFRGIPGNGESHRCTNAKSDILRRYRSILVARCSTFEPSNLCENHLFQNFRDFFHDFNTRTWLELLRFIGDLRYVHLQNMPRPIQSGESLMRFEKHRGKLRGNIAGFRKIFELWLVFD
jgi:hypothetical protein